jgi:hypothetical protein
MCLSLHIPGFLSGFLLPQERHSQTEEAFFSNLQIGQRIFSPGLQANGPAQHESDKAGDFIIRERWGKAIPDIYVTSRLGEFLGGGRVIRTGRGSDHPPLLSKLISPHSCPRKSQETGEKV